jgi:hypothetical protein
MCVGLVQVGLSDPCAADVLLLTRDVCADNVVSHDRSVCGSESDQ